MFRPLKGMRFEFDWDPAKAASNLAKHAVSFDMAMGVFRDPLALSRLDDSHAMQEERWLTLGISGSSGHILVVHTHIEVQIDHVRIRIISARRPTKQEIRQYEEG